MSSRMLSRGGKADVRDKTDSIFEGEPCQFAEDIFDRQLDSENEFIHLFPSGFPTLAERYAERGNEIHVHFSLCEREYCAVFYRPVVNNAFDQLAVIRAECRKIDGGGDKVEMPVLFDISKTIKKSEKIVRTVRTQSVVRLQALDSCLYGCVHSTQLLANTVGVERGFLIAQGKSGERRGSLAVSDDEISREMIQGSSEVVKGIAQAERQALRRSINIAADAPGMLQSFALEIVNNYTWFRLTEVNDFFPKRAHVIVRPYELGLKAT